MVKSMQVIYSLKVHTPEDIEGEPEVEKTPTPGVSVDSEQLLQEFSELFSAYQEALSNGNWKEAGELMTEIETRLNQANQ